ncbi:SNPC1 protein, partial [Amia calva]|nr:SNPC1 protein [Amia calva]
MAAHERKRFCSLALATASHYFLPPYSFQIRVGGLYLLYGLYYSQRCQPRQKVRLALKDWDEVLKFQQDVRSAQHFDAAYILRKLFSDRAFQFTAMPKLLCYRSKKKLQQHSVCEEFRDRPARVKELLSLDTLEEMQNVHEHYHTMKCSISGDRSQPDRALSLVQTDLIPQLKGAVLDFHSWQENRTKGQKRAAKGDSGADNDDDNDNDGAGEGSSQQVESSRRAQMLASIKSKSYGQLVEASKARRHRQTELDSSGSGTDHGPRLGGSHKKRPLSLKARFERENCGKGELKPEPGSQRRLSSIAEGDDTEEEAKTQPKRKKRRFKW